MSDLEEFKNFLNTAPNLSDEEMISLIEQRVNHMLETEPELLMSYLYRLDVLEEKINAVLNQPSEMPIGYGLSKLIWDRQKLRIELRKQFKQGPIEDGWEF